MFTSRLLEMILHIKLLQNFNVKTNHKRHGFYLVVSKAHLVEKPQNHFSGACSEAGLKELSLFSAENNSAHGVGTLRLNHS